MPQITVAECRQVLGSQADEHSDEELLRLRDSLEALAGAMYTEVAAAAQRDPEAVRWASYAFENPEDAIGSDFPDDAVPIDGPNLVDEKLINEESDPE